MKQTLVPLFVVFTSVAVLAAPPQVRFVDCAQAGFDPALARAVFEAESRAPGPPLEVLCQAGGLALVRRGAVSRQVRLDGLSPTVRGTTLGMVLIELARDRPEPKPAAPPEVARTEAPREERPLPGTPVAGPRPLATDSTAPVSRPGAEAPRAPDPAALVSPPFQHEPVAMVEPSPPAPPLAAGAGEPAGDSANAAPPDLDAGRPAPPSSAAAASSPVADGGVGVADGGQAFADRLTALFEGPHGAGETLVPVDAALIPSLSVNGAVGGRTRNLFALGLAASRATHLDGFGLGVGASLVDESMHGVQVAGFLVSADAALGLQLSGGLARAARVYGLQAGGLASWSGADTLGLQLSGGLSYTGGAVWGAQVGLATLAGPVRGVQLGLFALAHDVDGAQVGLLSIAGKVRGVQLALVNIAGDVDGAQVGLLNIGRRVRGAQLGLVNLAESSDVPFGLVSLIGDGGARAAAWASVSTVANLSLQLGGRHVYTFVAVGWNPRGNGRSLPFGPGLGWRSSADRGLNAGLELSHQYLWELNTHWTNSFVSTLRGRVGYRFADRLNVFAGLQLEVYGQFAPQATLNVPFAWVASDVPEFRVTLAPGLVAGVEL